MRNVMKWLREFFSDRQSERSDELARLLWEEF